MHKLLVPLKRVALSLVLLALVLSILHFPRDVDAPLTTREIEKTRQYFAGTFGKAESSGHQAPAKMTAFQAIASTAADRFGIEAQMRRFVADYNLTDKAVLEIGSGRGNLQDIVADYTGLDIAFSAARFYHKKFVAGSATALPFPDDSFDAIWSIWVLEHVDNPEQALVESRRVTRSGGLLYWAPGWQAAPWSAQGYRVRPYSDFDLTGKIIKASIPLRSTAAFRALSLIPVRLVRQAAALSGPTRLYYRRLTPNYETYWDYDADAVNSIDSHEAKLWYESRGDECLNCESPAVLMGFGPLLIRVNKR